MQEKLLQFIWQHSLYNPAALATSAGEQITVIYPGRLNTHAGPDFLDARIKIGNTTLAGHVELHINSSDWNRHGHQYDAAYQNIVLHVVFHNDDSTVVPNVPTLELAKHIAPAILDKYSNMVQGNYQLPCANQLAAVKDITKESWLSRLLAERWEEKLVSWKELLDTSAGDWRNLLYWRLAANFGFKVNAEPFLMLAQSLPLNIIAKHHGNLMQIEALLFGQAGMLDKEFTEDYPMRLKVEYNYLRQKYQLSPIAGHLWKFLRMRPANFPTVRIAQFAALIHRSMHLFSQIVEQHSVKDMMPLLEVAASEYWNDHCRFGEAQDTSQPKKLGKDSIHNIIINTIAPIQFLYAAKQGSEQQQEKALQLLEAIPAEKNSILEIWQQHNWKARNAADSQALIQLYNSYCTSKRCLDCAVGLAILKSGPKE